VQNLTFGALKEQHTVNQTLNDNRRSATQTMGKGFLGGTSFGVARFLSCVLLHRSCQRCRRFQVRRNYLHILPIVCKLLAAIEAHYISASGHGGSRASLSRTGREREAVVFV
jgi:hypothetical protein